jgi:hypothetical protein
MIILPNGTSLQLVTSATANIDVFATWGDFSASPIAPGSLRTAIASATTTAIVAAPGAGVTRGIKFLSIFNKHASASNTITLQCNDGTAGVIRQATLLAGESLVLDDGNWAYLGSNGVPKTATAPVIGGSATITMPADGAFEDEEVITALGVTPSSRVLVYLAPGADSNENTADMLDLVTLSGISGTDQITVQAQFSTKTSGPILLNWSIL